MVRGAFFPLWKWRTEPRKKKYSHSRFYFPSLAKTKQTVASFLCHSLGLDWRRGAEHFENLLNDSDTASNCERGVLVLFLPFSVSFHFLRRARTFFFSDHSFFLFPSKPSKKQGATG